jgi:hypothetical protein
MESPLTKIVKEKIKKSGEKLSSFAEKRIDGIFREIKKGEFTAREVTHELKKEPRLDSLTDKDFEEIEKEVLKMIRH